MDMSFDTRGAGQAPMFRELDPRTAVPKGQPVGDIDPGDVAPQEIEPVDIREMSSASNQAEQPKGRSIPTLSRFQQGLLVGGVAFTAISTLFGGGGGAPHADELTETAQKVVLDSTREGWNATDSLVQISRQGVQDEKQLEIIIRTAEEASGDSWDGAHNVVVSALQNEELTEVHVDTVGEMLDSRDTNPKFDETQAVIETLRTDNINPSHNRLAILIDEYADAHKDFTYGNKLLQTGLANARLADEQVETIRHLLQTEGHQNPHFNTRKAALAVASNAPFDEHAKDLVVAIAQAAAEQTDFKDANQLITRVAEEEFSGQKAELSTHFLSAQNLEGNDVAGLLETIFDGYSLDDNQFELAAQIGHSLARHDWNPGPVLSTKPLLKQEEAPRIKRLLKAEGIDPYKVIVGSIDNRDSERALTAELLEELTVAEARVVTGGGTRHLREAHTRLSEVMNERGEQYNYKEGLGSAILGSALENPDFTEHNLAVIEHVLESERGLDNGTRSAHEIWHAKYGHPRLLELAAEGPGLNQSQAEAMFALMDEPYGVQMQLPRQVPHNPDFGANHLKLLSNLLSRASFGNYSDQKMAIETVISAPSLDQEQTNLALSMVELSDRGPQWMELFGETLHTPVSAQQRGF